MKFINLYFRKEEDKKEGTLVITFANKADCKKFLWSPFNFRPFIKKPLSGVEQAIYPSNTANINYQVEANSKNVSSEHVVIERLKKIYPDAYDYSKVKEYNFPHFNDKNQKNAKIQELLFYFQRFSRAPSKHKRFLTAVVGGIVAAMALVSSFGWLAIVALSLTASASLYVGLKLRERIFTSKLLDFQEEKVPLTDSEYDAFDNGRVAAYDWDVYLLSNFKLKNCSQWRSFGAGLIQELDNQFPRKPKLHRG